MVILKQVLQPILIHTCLKKNLNQFELTLKNCLCRTTAGRDVSSTVWRRLYAETSLNIQWRRLSKRQNF